MHPQTGASLTGRKTMVTYVIPQFWATSSDSRTALLLCVLVATHLRLAVSVVGKVRCNPNQVTLLAIQNNRVHVYACTHTPANTYSCTVCVLCKRRSLRQQERLSFSPEHALQAVCLWGHYYLARGVPNSSSANTRCLISQRFPQPNPTPPPSHPTPL